MSQTVYVSGSAGDTFVLAGWAKGDAVQKTDLYNKDRHRYFGLRLVFHGTDGAVKESEVASFNPDVNSQVAWQYTAAPIVAEVDYSYVEVQILYDYNANTVMFDGIQLYKEEFGSSYTRENSSKIIRAHSPPWRKPKFF